MKDYWVSCLKFTVGVKVKNDNFETIIDAAPIVSKFIGQPFENLKKFANRFGGLLVKDITLRKPRTGDTMELHLKHRPTKLSEVVGQEAVCRALHELGKKGETPHAILLTGPSGTGKTTIARILKDKLQCHDADFVEMNGSNNRGIDDMRRILNTVNSAPIAGKCRVWMIDECHAITPDAQNCILKVLEDTPKHVYFLLCTTDPQKLKKTIITRCTEFRCKSLNLSEIEKLVKSVAEKEEQPIDSEVAETIARCSDGSARQAVKLLNSVINLPKEAQLEAIQSQDLVSASVHLGRMLFNEKTTWKDIQEALKKIDEEAETVRHMVLGYAKAMLLSNAKGSWERAADVISAFRDPFYDKGATLALACYEVLNGK